MTQDEAYETAFGFDVQADDQDDADIWVDETYTNKYGDERAVLGGDTYGAFVEDELKQDLDWDITHHKFDGDDWQVDVAGLDHFADVVGDAGYVVDAATGHTRDNADSALFDTHAFIEEDDDIAVEYAQKNGEGTNTKTGTVVDVSYNSGYEDKPMIAFRRDDDDHYMYFQFDKHGKVALYTGGSHAPFVGAVETVTVTTEENRDLIESVEEGREAAEAAEADGPDATDLPWNNGADA